MIDLHCHMLPGIDDGAPDLATALEMARIAVADGITRVACTPHIYPGMYQNDRGGILAAINAFRHSLAEEDLPLEFGEGADVHLAPDLIVQLQQGRIPLLNGSRYLLLEPPHHVAPPRFEGEVFCLMTAGYVPVVTHPERLSWIETHYPIFERLVASGVLMQVTAGSVTGRFGKRPRYWAERMLDESLVHVLATDAHDTRRRPPRLAEGADAAAKRVGDAEARHLVETRPLGIWENCAPRSLPPLPEPRSAMGLWDRLRPSWIESRR